MNRTPDRAPGRPGLTRALVVCALVAVAVSVAGDPDRSEPKKIKRAVEVRAGHNAAPENVKLHTSARGTDGLQETPIVVDLRKPEVRAFIDQRIKGASTPAQIAPKAAPPATQGVVRRIEFDVPEVEIVNRTERWVFLPNLQKMNPEPEAQNAQ